jgi:hypothetical protein
MPATDGKDFQVRLKGFEPNTNWEGTAGAVMDLVWMKGCRFIVLSVHVGKSTISLVCIKRSVSQ